MPIIGGAVIPHFPMLIASIGGSRTSLLEPILTGIGRVSESIRNLNPDTLVVIAPHGEERTQYQGFVSERLTVDLKEFGDITHTATFEGNYLPLFQLKKHTPKELALVSESSLRYATGIPLLLITEGLQTPPSVTAIHTSSAQPVEHVAFGAKLREVLETGSKSYYLIASADFSRYTISVEDGEAKASSVDRVILQSLRSNNLEQLLHPAEHGDYLASWVCGVKPLCVVLGSLSGANYTTSIVSFDRALGIGLLVATFEL